MLSIVYKLYSGFCNQKSDSCNFYKPDLDGRLQEFAAFILQGLGFPSKQRAWAGPDHWKFSKHKGLY